MSQLVQRSKHKGTNCATPKHKSVKIVTMRKIRPMFQDNAFPSPHHFAFCIHSLHYLATLFDWLQQMGKVCLIANCLCSSTLTFSFINFVVAFITSGVQRWAKHD